jgi:hypothetical protein
MTATGWPKSSVRAHVGGEKTDRPGEKGAVGPDREHQVRVRLKGPVAEFPVRGEVILPPSQ